MTTRLERPPEWVPVIDGVEALVEDLHEVRSNGTVRIFSGEANTVVYNDDRFLQAAEDIVTSRHAVIRAITGPIVNVDEKGFNGLLDLERKSKAKVRHRVILGPMDHFRIVETDDGYRYYAEYPHAPLTPTSERLSRNLDAAALLPWDAFYLADSARSVFDSWWDRLGKMEKTIPCAEYLPFTATSSDLLGLIRIAEQEGKSFSYLNPEDLLSLPNAREMLLKRSLT